MPRMQRPIQVPNLEESTKNPLSATAPIGLSPTTAPTGRSPTSAPMGLSQPPAGSNLPMQVRPDRASLAAAVLASAAGGGYARTRRPSRGARRRLPPRGTSLRAVGEGEGEEKAEQVENPLNLGFGDDTDMDDDLGTGAAEEWWAGAVLGWPEESTVSCCVERVVWLLASGGWWPTSVFVLRRRIVVFGCVREPEVLHAADVCCCMKFFELFLCLRKRDGFVLKTPSPVRRPAPALKG